MKVFFTKYIRLDFVVLQQKMIVSLYRASAKIIEWTDYLKSLGINAVLLNPIFESDNHGYDTRDFLKIDCRLGTNGDFSDVCQHLHQNDIRIVLDGVFNHVGRGFLGIFKM